MTDEGSLDLFEAQGRTEEAAGTPAPPRVWSVSEINSAVRALLEDTLPPVWVGGESTNWTRARSGHCYFTLKDDRAQLRCVMWKSHAGRLPIDPDEGTELRALGRLTLYEARGDYQLAVQELHAEGEEGLWKLAFERLRARLEQEGLLDPARKRPLPRFPRTVGVVTSTTGAALRDVLSVIRRRAPWTRVLVRGTRVQGEGAASEVAAAVRLLGGSGLVDVLIVGRGGGSIEDLWAFNEEPVARAVAECPVPVVSAVGHETDVTISDLVADLRAPTPSAAAEAVVLDGAALMDVLAGVRPRLARGLRRRLEWRRERLDRLGRDLERRARGSIERRRHRLARASAQVEALSPLSTLRRGYAVALSPDGKVLRSVASFRARPAFQLRVVDGRIDCETRAVHPEGEG